MKTIQKTETIKEGPIVKPCHVNVEAVWSKFSARRRVSEEINEYLFKKISANSPAERY
ncbi:MAG: hypothetical protein IJR61_05630 [Clostridia bacterium]|nr:hypothetical protein [Clostridia bacterium]